MIGYVSLAIVVILAIMILSWLISGYNKGIQLKNYVTESFSTMDVYMKKRWDLVPNLLETTKGYAEHEKGIFEEVTKLRNQNYTGMSDEQKIDINNQMAVALSKLVAVAENYPDLKADTNFRQFSEELLSCAFPSYSFRAKKYHARLFLSISFVENAVLSCSVITFCKFESKIKFPSSEVINELKDFSSRTGTGRFTSVL